ncbi:MAG: N-acetylmuramoyl-L-alanine amidase-like domain-containing protein [Muribaculaceae bacterium]
MRSIVLYIIMWVGVAGVAMPREIRWYNEASDTTRVAKILTQVASHRWSNPSERTAAVARMFLDVPYVAHTLEGSPEMLTVNLDELDCTTFIDIAVALSYTAGEGRTGWQDFVFNLERWRYRGGEVNGYSSRLHYNCDWAVNNIHRGYLMDLTTNLPKCQYIVRTISYMSNHRSSYEALADSTEYARVLEVENGYRNHRFPYIKVQDLRSKEVDSRLREGDIIAFVSNLKDLDVTHLGMVVKVNGETRVMHASSTDGKVEISDVSLYEFVRRNRNWIGARFYRLKD